MTRTPDPGHVARIVRVDARRLRRRLSEKPAQLVALAVAALFVLLPSAAAGFLAYVGADALAGNPELLSLARSGVAGVFALLVVLTGFRAITQTSKPDNLDGMLTTVPPRDLYAAQVVTEFAGVVAYGGLAVLAAAVGLGLGAGSPIAAVLLLAAVGLLAPFGVATGIALGFGVKNLAARSELVARFRLVIWAVVFVLYMGTFITNSQNAVIQPVVAALDGTPLAWFADLAFLSLAPAASVPAAVGAVALGLVGTAVAFAVGLELATAYWYADHARAPEETRAAETSLDAGRLAGVVGTGAAWVARKSFARTRRSPIKLVYVAYPAFAITAPVAEAIQTGRVPTTLPALLTVYAAWAGGAAFALNPLGDEGAVLPITVTSGIRGRTFVTGLLLPGAAVGTAASVVLGVGTGVLAGLAPVQVATLAVAGVVLGCGAPAMAAAVGTAYPQFEASRVTRSRQAVVPSIWAFGGYSLPLLLLAVPAMLGAVPFVADGLAGLTGLSPTAVSAGGVALTAVLVAAASLLGFRYAAVAFDEFRLD